MKWIASSMLVVCLASTVWAKPPVPREAADFRVVDASGKPMEFSHYYGKVVVVQFLFTTCSHCQATARMLSKLQTEFAPRGLQVLGVAFNPEAQQPQVIGEFIKNNDVTFPVGSAYYDAVISYLGVSASDRVVVPQIMIIDRRGLVRAQSDFSGSPELQDETYLRGFLGDLLKAPK